MTIRDNEQQRRFEMEVDGHTAFIEYRRSGHAMTLVHTEVPKELAGRGVGSALAKGALELIRARAEEIIPQCPFIAAYIGKHPAYAGLVAPRADRPGDAVERESCHSFPASDPPSWTPVLGPGSSRR